MYFLKGFSVINLNFISSKRVQNELKQSYKRYHLFVNLMNNALSFSMTIALKQLYSILECKVWARCFI